MVIILNVKRKYILFDSIYPPLNKKLFVLIFYDKKKYFPGRGRPDLLTCSHNALKAFTMDPQSTFKGWVSVVLIIRDVFYWSTGGNYKIA